MSTLTFSSLEALSGGNINIPSRHILDVKGNIKIPNWTTSNRPSGVTGTFGFNTTTNKVEVYNGTSWTDAGAIGKDGATQTAAAASGLQLKTDFPSLPTGLYWIKSSSMPTALQMWVDMTEDGGGYDFYAISSGTSVSFITDNHSGVALGLELWEGRSPECWRAAVRAAFNLDSGNFMSYFQAVGHVYKPNGGGNYTGCIMRSSFYGGNNCADWRVKSGGRWWIRNTTHSEPNGDYSGNGFLQIYGGAFTNPFDLNTNMGFNDGGAYSTGTRYLVSTNSKV